MSVWLDQRFVTKPSLMLGRVLALVSRFTAESFRDEWMLACELSLSLVICINASGFVLIAEERAQWMASLSQAIKHAEMAVGTNLHGVRNACVYTMSCARTLISAQSSDASVDYAQLSLQCLQTMVATAANHLHVGGLIGVESKASALSAQFAQWLLAEGKRKYYKHTAGPLLLMWPHAHANPSVECVRAFQSQFGEIMTQTRGVFWERQVTYLGVLHAQLQQILARSEATTDERHSPLYSSDDLLLLCDALLFGGRTSALPGLVHGHEFKATFLRGDWRVREKCVTAIVDLLITCKRQLNARTADLAAARCMHDLLVLMFVHRCILEDVRQVRETLEWALRNICRTCGTSARARCCEGSHSKSCSRKCWESDSNKRREASTACAILQPRPHPPRVLRLSPLLLAAVPRLRRRSASRSACFPWASRRTCCDCAVLQGASQTGASTSGR